MALGAPAAADEMPAGEVVVPESEYVPPPQYVPPPEPMPHAYAPVGRVIDPYDDSQSNPLRLAAYALHPVGYLAEWLVMRPLHRIFAQDDLEPVFGHVPHDGYDFETYTEGLGTGVSYGYDQTLNAQRYSTAPVR
jgi:hypothetical protein